MSVKFKNKKQKSQNRSTTAPSPPNNLSSTELVDIIANAMVRAEEIKEETKHKNEEKKREEWKRGLGLKSYKKLNPCLRVVATLINLLFVFIKLPFIRKSKIKNEYATTELLKLVLNCFLSLVCIIFTIIALKLLAGDSLDLLWEFLNYQSLDTSEVNVFFGNVLRVIYGILFYMMAGLFHLASIEVELMEDRNVFFGAFASFASLVSVVIAIISFVLSVISIARGGYI